MVTRRACRLCKSALPKAKAGQPQHYCSKSCRRRMEALRRFVKKAAARARWHEERLAEPARKGETGWHRGQADAIIRFATEHVARFGLTLEEVSSCPGR